MENNLPGRDRRFGETDAEPVRFSDWLNQSARQLSAARAEADLSAAMCDIRLLAQKKLDLSRTYLMAHPELPLADRQRDALNEGVQRLSDGEALPYLLGEWEFFGRMFTLTPDVLIPRPETEMIIERVISWAKEHKMTRLKLADAGTGSGCIAVSLALELPGAQVTAADISSAALQTTRVNVHRHGVQKRVSLVQSDLLTSFTGRSFQVICANLPYIPSGRLPELAVSRCEPRLALDGGPDGLDLLVRLIADCDRLLEPCGLALFEIDDSHTEAALKIAQKNFTGSAEVIQDYQGKPRLLRLEKGCGQA